MAANAVFSAQRTCSEILKSSGKVMKHGDVSAFFFQQTQFIMQLTRNFKPIGYTELIETQAGVMS